MGVRNYDLRKNGIVRGATWKFTVNYLQSDGTTPIEGLDTAEARLRIRRAGDSDLTWTATIDADAGAITIEKSAEDTAALNFSRASFVLEVEFAGGEIRPLITGAIETV